MANKIEIPSRGTIDLSDPFLAGRPVTIPGIRWGAIFAGIAVGISIQFALALLGLATGLTTLDTAEGETVSPTTSLIGADLSRVVAGLVGAYVAARMSGLKRQVDGLLQGVVTWGVTTLMIAILATSISSLLLSGIFSAIAAGDRNQAIQCEMDVVPGSCDARLPARRSACPAPQTITAYCEQV